MPATSAGNEIERKGSVQDQCRDRRCETVGNIHVETERASIGVGAVVLGIGRPDICPKRWRHDPSQRNPVDKEFDNRRPARFAPAIVPVFGPLLDIVPFEEQTLFPIADDEIDREEQAQEGMDFIEIPASPVASADAGQCQERNDQHREQSGRNSSPGPARVAFEKRSIRSVFGHVSRPRTQSGVALSRTCRSPRNQVDGRDKPRP